MNFVDFIAVPGDEGYGDSSPSHNHDQSTVSIPSPPSTTGTSLKKNTCLGI